MKDKNKVSVVLAGFYVLMAFGMFLLCVMTFINLEQGNDRIDPIIHFSGLAICILIVVISMRTCFK